MNNNLERENYDFIGWTCDKDSSQTPSKYLDIMTEWQSNITLTAHWQPKQQYVFYYLNGGTFSNDITTPEIKQGDGVLYSLFNVESDDFTLPTPTKPGYNFIGWGVGGTSDVYPTVTIKKGTVGNQAYDLYAAFQPALRKSRRHLWWQIARPRPLPYRRGGKHRSDTEP